MAVFSLSNAEVGNVLTCYISDVICLTSINICSLACFYREKEPRFETGFPTEMLLYLFLRELSVPC